MKIGMIFDDEFPPHPRIWNEAYNLNEAGHTVYLFCFTYSGKSPSEMIDGIRVIRYTAPPFLRKISALAYSNPVYHWLIQRKIRDFILENEIEILHVHNMRVARAVIMACRNIRIRKVLDLHENVPEIMKYYHHVRKFPGNILIFPPVWKRWERKLVDRFDKTVVVTDEAKQDLVSEYHTDPGKIIVVPNSVQPVFYTGYSIDQTVAEKFAADFVMLYFGDTGLRRGLETSIMSIPALAEMIPNIKLVIVGKSKSDPELKQLARKTGAEKYISFEGFQDEKLLQSYILSSHICISPLLRNKHHDTTYANKLFQYMALGKPILASDCTAQKRIVLEADSGLIHEAGNIHDFAGKIILLYRDEMLRTRLGENGKMFIRNQYNQKLKSSDLLRFYREAGR